MRSNDALNWALAACIAGIAINLVTPSIKELTLAYRNVKFANARLY